MIEAAVPENERERLKFLNDIHILDTPVEERFDRITRVVCRALNVPIAAISLIDEQRQWFKSIQGVSAAETPRSMAFCAHAILDDAPLVVEDATKDVRFHDNPLVADDPSIRFYAGIPLTNDQGVNIGTLCAIDNKPRTISLDEIAILQDLKTMVEIELQTAAKAAAQRQMLEDVEKAARAEMIDPLTRLWNRAGAEQLLQRAWALAQREAGSVALALLQIEHLATVQAEYGAPAVERALRCVVETMQAYIRPEDLLCRWDAQTFLLLARPNTSDAEAAAVLERVQRAVNLYPILTPWGDFSVSIRTRFSMTDPAQLGSAEALAQLEHGMV